MNEFIINPENYKEQYIENLNECFNGWGGEREYEWVFERKVGDLSSDILLIQNEEDGIIAGSGISYRKIAGDNGETFDIGIMTGSWTLPAARRKGCFTKMINCSRELCDKNNVPFLTAFVTESNPSSRRLEAEGSFMFPTYHLFSPVEPFENLSLEDIEKIEDKGSCLEEIYKALNQGQQDFLNFKYTKSEFEAQYVDRIKETTVLKINNDFAILEDGNNETKILLLTYGSLEDFRVNIKLLTNWCLKYTSKKAFLFTTREQLSEVCLDLGFENVPGYFTILKTFDDAISYEEKFRGLNINMADKM